MSNLTDRALQSIFGCPNSSNTSMVNVVGASGVVELDPNEIYRLTTTTDCFISLDAAPSGLITSASGVRLFPCVPEMFSTTSNLVWLNTLQDNDGGALTGKLNVTKMLTRSA
jgi:hypothetical protein